MGQFRIEITAVGGHGCAREPKEGERVYGCRRMDCPDCIAAEVVQRLAHSGANVEAATLTHWPSDPAEVVDRIEPGAHHAQVTRAKGSFAR